MSCNIDFVFIEPDEPCSGPTSARPTVAWHLSVEANRVDVEHRQIVGVALDRGTEDIPLNPDKYRTEAEPSK